MEKYTKTQLINLAKDCDVVEFMKYKYPDDVNEPGNIVLYSDEAVYAGVDIDFEFLPYDSHGEVSANVIYMDGKTFFSQYVEDECIVGDDKVMVVILKVGTVSVANKWNLSDMLFDKNCCGLDVFRYKYVDGIFGADNLIYECGSDYDVYNALFDLINIDNYDTRILRDNDMQGIEWFCYPSYKPRRTIPSGKFLIAIILPRIK